LISAAREVTGWSYTWRGASHLSPWCRGDVSKYYLNKQASGTSNIS